jgi:hypothetical protein
MSHDPELSEVESTLFELMRDGVITALRQIHSDRWRCETSVPYDEPTKFSARTGIELQGRFHEGTSALAAYMEAFSFIMTRKLEGEPIYSRDALVRRRKLGLPT